MISCICRSLSVALLFANVGHVAIADEKPGKADAPKRLTPAQASAIFSEHLNMKKNAELPLKELTTDAIWKNLKVQVFQLKYTEKMPSRPTVVIKDGKAINIGRDFGGDGVNSVCAAELADKKAYLVYSFAWGSGIHRSQLGALDVFAKEPKEIVAGQSLVLDFEHDWSVRAINGKTVRVEGGGVSFGDLVLTEKDGVRTLSIRLAKDLPEKIRKNVQGEK